MSHGPLAIGRSRRRSYAAPRCYRRREPPHAVIGGLRNAHLHLLRLERVLPQAARVLSIQRHLPRLLLARCTASRVAQGGLALLDVLPAAASDLRVAAT